MEQVGAAIEYSSFATGYCGVATGSNSVAANYVSAATKYRIVTNDNLGAASEHLTAKLC